MTSAPDLQAVEKRSIQVLPDAQTGAGASSFFSWDTTRGPILPAWGTREREKALRLYSRNEYNTLVQGAFSGLTKRWVATPWEISGPKRATKLFQDIFRAADFGRGWSSFISKLALDFLRQDGGAYVEVIAPGDPTKAPTGPVMALANLDSLRCYPTGDPEYPVIYYNRAGKMHLLHHTRVLHFVDMPDGDESNPGYGLSALSRSIAVVQRQILMNQYMAARLDDKPAPGMILTKGITERQWNELKAKYLREISADMLSEWGRTMFVHAIAPDVPIEIEHIPFAQPPENFDYPTYVEIDVNELALAIGVDKQELWELGGGDLGSGAQSEVLHAKSQGKMFGSFLVELERKLNDVLPDVCEFSCKPQDPYEAVERAQAAQMWAGVTTTIGARLTADEARLLLANQIEAVKDAITDADGELIRLNDADPKADPQAPQIVADDQSPVASEGTRPSIAQPSADAPAQAAAPKPAAQTTAPGPAPKPQSDQSAPQLTGGAPAQGTNRSDVMDALNAGLLTIDEAQRLLGIPVDPAFVGMYMVDGTPVTREVYLQLYQTQFGRGINTFENALNASPPTEAKAISVKAIQATALNFTSDFEDLLAGARDSDFGRRRFGIVLRDLIRKYGRDAYLDGLADGGVDTERALEGDDLAEYQSMLVKQSAFVTKLGAAIYREDNVTDGQAANKPEMWLNKSIMPFYEAGRASADKNGMYEFAGEDGAESCATCTKLKGQRHRMKDWTRKGLRPRVDTSAFECGGWLCKHVLTKTTERASGKW